MAGDFKAGEGRVEFSGDATGARKAAKEAGSAVEDFSKKAKGARKTMEDVGKVLRFFVLPLAIAKTAVGVITELVRMREDAARVKAEFKAMGDAAVAAFLKIRAEAGKPLQADLVDMRAAVNAQIDAITKAADARIEAYNDAPAWKRLIGAAAGLQNPEEIEQQAARQIAQLNRAISRAAKPDTIQQRVNAIKDEAKAAARETMTESERAAAEREDQEKKLNELRKENLTDEQRAEVEAAAKVFDKRRDFRRKEHSERVSLEDLAGKFDLANVSRAASSTTAAVNRQTEVMKRMGQGTVIKD